MLTSLLTALNYIETQKNAIFGPSEIVVLIRLSIFFTRNSLISDV